MTDQPSVTAPGYVAAEGHEQPAHDDRPAEPPLFRFRLRHLLAFFAAVSLLLAGVVTFRGIPVLAFVLGVLVVTFHVFSTALGSRLRSHADREREHASSRPRQPLVRQPVPAPWYSRETDSLPWIPRLVATAVFFGGCLGAGFLTLTVGPKTSAAGLAVGAVSFAAISGWFAFLVANFYAAFRRGLREALDGERGDKAKSE